MKKVMLFLTTSFILSACSTQIMTSTDSMQVASDSTTATLTEPTSDAPIGGSADYGMDELDRKKLSRALDGGIGKATSWQNANTGTKYTVVPVEKLTIQGNPFCRKYTVTTEKGGYKKEVNGTACVATDGAWHPV